MDHLIANFARTPTQLPLTEDVVLEDHGQSRVYRGRTAVLPILRAYFVDGFADSRATVHTTLTNEQTIVIAFVFNGRHQSLFLGIPATGREVTVPMILLGHISQQHIQHIILYYDAGTILRQLGLAL
ncbi:MAG: ester cyclase [Anaerolineae bacterium]|nr:ester cyclase [Anaerolineae bacterium]